MPALEPIVREVDVACAPEAAFATFVEGFGVWWPKALTIGRGQLADVVIEPRAGGRWYGVDSDGAEAQWGEVLALDPPRRLLLAWRIGADWAYHADLHTEVAVTFTPSGTGVQVRLEHRGLEAMGAMAAAAHEVIGGPAGWGAILDMYRMAAEQP